MMTMQSKDPRRHHTPDDDPESGTPGTADDICPECAGTGKQVDKETGKQISCERCDGTGLIIQGIG
jgi:DnaJ-class molecular chaperone